MIEGLKRLARKLVFWRYRDAGTGKFITKAEHDRRSKRTTVRERV
jgi:hypothetical protein